MATMSDPNAGDHLGEYHKAWGTLQRSSHAHLGLTCIKVRKTPQGFPQSPMWCGLPAILCPQNQRLLMRLFGGGNSD